MSLLMKLRSLMRNTTYVSEVLSAYVVPTNDAHQSEYVANCDKRREFISGFTGSAGTAVITEEKALLWTDGRYFLQAENQLSSEWTLMKQSVPGSVTKEEWMSQNLPSNSLVGVNPYCITFCEWREMSQKLSLSGHTLVPVLKDLVDVLWTDKPDLPTSSLLTLPVSFTGITWEEKVQEVQKKMVKNKSSVLLISALDEIAWLLNLRGSDIPFNPVFFAYVIVTFDGLYLFIDESKLCPIVRHHLKLTAKDSESKVNVTVYRYDAVDDYLSAFIKKADGKIWIPEASSYALASLAPQNKLVLAASPVAELKAVKNETEVEGMRNAHIRDGAALCELLYWLEKQLESGITITELDAVEMCKKFRSQQPRYVSLSFPTISSSGPNCAVIHYLADKTTNREITTDQMYLVDSGAQYEDGTTDITRTVHFGEPTDYMKECFTRVLKGHIRLNVTVFPENTLGRRLDSFAREALWEVGLDYLHGTGHGVGHFLNVHEGPYGISHRSRSTEIALKPGMILSDEPGYYENGSFGVRIENVMLTKETSTKYSWNKMKFLTFEMISFAPIQTKLIIPQMLNDKELAWLNDYHDKCRELVGAHLKLQGKLEVLEWLLKQTEPLG